MLATCRPIELLNERFLLAQFALKGAASPFGLVACGDRASASLDEGEDDEEDEDEDGDGDEDEDEAEHAQSDSDDGTGLQGDEGWCHR